MELTDCGKAFIEEIYARHEKDLEAVTGGLSEEERTRDLRRAEKNRKRGEGRDPDTEVRNKGKAGHFSLSARPGQRKE